MKDNPNSVDLYTVEPIFTPIRSRFFVFLWACNMILSGYILSQMETTLSSFLIAGLFAYFVADVHTGISHWVADTWGEIYPAHDKRASILNSVRTDFRVHHVRPKDVCRPSFWHTNGDSCGACVIVGLLPNACAYYYKDPFSIQFMMVWSVLLLCANQFHKWSHEDKPKIPKIVKILQRSGLILSVPHHRVHHQGHVGHYCMASGWMDYVLDGFGVFRGVEWIVESLSGLKPRADDEKYLTGQVPEPHVRKLKALVFGLSWFDLLWTLAHIAVVLGLLLGWYGALGWNLALIPLWFVSPALVWF
eukprot:NODE_4779_length_1115_cov_145.055444_g3861_i1.p1 GENE.NODE_4779_length_1115_cov_145.055444_g3861_i1~~NODE_4779_length_1115_cov_145.055444_g3861_i1.p1  ORF type:complete len:304 (-),score=23.64 NODE_4779_length_1115_cov_145.055444_g3861_i1:138-1049(-)